MRTRRERIQLGDATPCDNQEDYIDVHSLPRAGLIFCKLCNAEHTIYRIGGEQWYQCGGWNLATEAVKDELAYFWS